MNDVVKLSLLFICAFIQAGLSVGLKYVLVTPEIIESDIKYLVVPLYVIGLGGYAVLWQHLLKYTRLSFANSFMSLVPLLIFVAGVFFFNESVSLSRVLGMALIIVGIYLLHKQIKEDKNHANS